MGAKKIDLCTLNERERDVVEARRAYKRAWREANKDKVAEYERRFYERKAARLLEQSGGKGKL